MSRRGNLIDMDMEEQIAALRKELGQLNRAVARRGSSLYDDASERMGDYLADLSDYIPSMSVLRKRAKGAGRMAYDHPAVVATVGLVVLGLAASLFLGGRSSNSTPAARASARRAPRQSAADAERRTGEKRTRPEPGRGAR